MKNPLLLILTMLLCAAGGPLRAETAFTLRAVELKQEPFADAATIATLPEKTPVEIVKRQGGWTHIRQDKTTQGWVRMLSLRLGTGEIKKGESGLGSLLGLGRGGGSGVTVATGVRGLSEEELRHAKPNPEELQKMRNSLSTPQEARKFAESARLSAQSVGYLPAPAASAAPSSPSSPLPGEQQ